MAVSMALARLARFTATSCVAVGQVALRRVRIAFVIIMGKVYRTFVRVEIGSKRRVLLGMISNPRCVILMVSERRTENDKSNSEDRE